MRTVAAAWQRIPQARALERPVRILVRPGRYGRGAAELLGEPLGDARAPIVVAAARARDGDASAP